MVSTTVYIDRLDTVNDQMLNKIYISKNIFDNKVIAIITEHSNLYVFQLLFWMCFKIYEEINKFIAILMFSG